MKRISIKRVYEPVDKADGTRVLVDRIWPRGLSRDKVCIDYWAKDIAPSTQLRKWYDHEPVKWNEFRCRYFTELSANQTGVINLFTHTTDDCICLLFASREINLNNANALREYLISYQESADILKTLI